MFNNGSYRVRTPKVKESIVFVDKSSGRTRERSSQDTDTDTNGHPSNYLEIMQKLIPGESLSIFLLAQSIIPDESTIPGNIIAILVLAITIIIRVSETKEPNGSWDTVQWTVVALSTCICFFWMHAIGGIDFFPSNMIPDFQIISQMFGFALALAAPALLKLFGTGEVQKKDS